MTTPPVEPTPVEPRPVGPSPVESRPVEPSPVGPSPVEPSPKEAERRAPTSDAFPVPTGPRTTSVGGHVLGVLVGLVVTLVGCLLVTLGQSRILADGLGGDAVSPDALGIGLVTLGAVAVGIVVLFGQWTPAAPFTGGLVAVLVGAAYLFAPVAAHRETVRLLETQQNSTSVLNSISIATSGGLFLIGIVLLAAGTAFSLVRRRGVALGAFRERASSGPAAH